MRYAIYSEKESDKDLINKIYLYFKEKYKDCDFHIFSDNSLIFNDLNIASLSTFYIKFFDGNVIFCNESDCYSYQDILMKNCYLISSQDIEDKNYEKLKSNITILKVDGDRIYEL